MLFEDYHICSVLLDIQRTLLGKRKPIPMFLSFSTVLFQLGYSKYHCLAPRRAQREEWGSTFKAS